MFSTINDPSTHSNQKDDSKSSDTVVHVGSGDGKLGWEYEKDGGEDGPGNTNETANPSDRSAELERSVFGK